jgi:cytochrome c oxidase assembly protein subunit 15
VLAANSYFLYLITRGSSNTNILVKSTKYCVALLFFEFFSGVAMAALDIPAFIQPIHLLCASLIFGLQFFMLVVLYFNANVRSEISVKMESL